MCQPVDEATAWLTWDLIVSAEHPEAGRPELYQGGDCYVGMDIGRRRDLTVIWVLERVGDILWTREVVRLKGATFAAQDAEEDRIMSTYRVRRLCQDQTGMGEKPVEDSKRRYGEYRVEGVLFSSPVKQELATGGKQYFEDRKLRTPQDREIRESHHAVRKLTTQAGNPRFDAARSEVGHADEFWAHMLAIHAANDPSQPAAGANVEHDESAYAPQAARGRVPRRMFR
jgi:phage FluMu gp28-like protein